MTVSTPNANPIMTRLVVAVADLFGCFSYGCLWTHGNRRRTSELNGGGRIAMELALNKMQYVVL